MRDSLTTVIVNWNKVLCGGLHVSVLWGAHYDKAFSARKRASGRLK